MKDSYNIPGYEDAKRYVEKLQNVDWPMFNNYSTTKEYIKAVQDIIFTDFEFIPNILKRLKPSKFLLPFYRVRAVSSFTDINLFSEHSYPPIKLTGFNRCNFPNSPVFYCSDNPLVALKEVVRNNDYSSIKYCLSKWELDDSENEIIFQSFLHMPLLDGSDYKSLRDAEIEQFQTLFNGITDDQVLGLIELLKFLHNAFINDANYELSAALAYRSLNPPHNYATDILMYPSIQTDYKGVNMAIHPNFVDNRMKLLRFYIVELKSHNLDSGRFNISITKYGLINRNKITWYNVRPDDDNYLKMFREDFKNQMNDGDEYSFIRTE
ncbi:RES domain-containing protein [Flagellimonas abyssi]|uniref:RES domain-containing protein n=1 Tax=Flagellimonas abyssi TaxID=2864871 RepID=A0ABS7EW36_9FLAO|nr:RES domain-containing protein [Allomuricauda abyssi]MBW8201842.1 RES domain-containing protein [Allomuricauda abyssi]